MTSKPAHLLTALELSAAFAAGIIKPSHALDAIYAQMDRVNPTINAVIAENRPAAILAAQAADGRWAAGSPLSPLDGVPITIKDNIHVAGLPARWGSRLHDDGAAVADEPAISRLRAAGLVILGKTNVPEFTLQGYTDNALFGVTRNPHAPELTPGGSTGGGAAAVAAGIAPLAIGTDGGGSARRPAAHCGIYGFKPSIGQIARSGGFPQILADFEVIAPLARTAGDLAALFAILRGSDPTDPASRIAELPAQPFSATPRIGYFRNIGDAPVDKRISGQADTLAAQLAASGCLVVPITAPFDPQQVNAAWGTVAQAGLAWHLAGYADAMDRVGDNARNMAALGNSLSAVDLNRALAACSDIRRAACLLLEQYDMLLCPSTAALAWPAAEPFPPIIDGQDAGPRGHALFTAWMNVTGLAAVSVPVAMTGDRGGIGMQLVAAMGRDQSLLHFLITNEAIRTLPPAVPAKDFP